MSTPLTIPPIPTVQLPADCAEAARELFGDGPLPANIAAVIPLDGRLVADLLAARFERRCAAVALADARYGLGELVVSPPVRRKRARAAS